MADSIYYLKKLREYLSGAGVLDVYTERLGTIEDVMGDSRRLQEMLDSGREGAEQGARAFISALFGIFPKESVYGICKIMADNDTGLDGKETLFYFEAALLEVRRYFYRHQKQIAEIMRRCGFPYEQYNEALLPLASVARCSYEPPHMRPERIFPDSYRDMRLPPLPVAAEFIEPDRGADILRYIDPEIREGLLSRGQKDFFSRHADFFSTLFADSVLFLSEYTSIPDGIEDKDQVQRDLLEYVTELCKSSNIEPDTWVDASLLNTWLSRDSYDQLRRCMKQAGVAETVLTDERPDMPGWETRFHASKVQFSYWKPFGHGFIRMGANCVTEYQSLGALRRAVSEEAAKFAGIERMGAYIELLERIQAEGFEKTALGNLPLFAGLAAAIRTKEIPEGSCFCLYYNRVCGAAVRDGQYRLLIPPVGGGDALKAIDDVITAKAEPPFEFGEAPVNCAIRKTTVYSPGNTNIRVKAAAHGLMRGREILSSPYVEVEAPVSPAEKLEELAESLDNIIRGIRTEKDILGVRRYINSFIHIVRSLGQVSGEAMDTREKAEWISQNGFVHNLLVLTPEEGFNNIASVLDRYGEALNGRVRLSEYREAFYAAWGSCAARLNSIGIVNADKGVGADVSLIR